jgi:hypothetical protein
VARDPDGSDNRSELSAAKDDLRRYWNGRIRDDVKELIHSIAADRAVSDSMIEDLQPRLKKMRRSLVRIALISYSIAALPIFTLTITGNEKYLEGKGFVGGGLPNAFFLWEIAVMSFLARYWIWRREHGSTCAASYLLAAVERGIQLHGASTDSESRDIFAKAIQDAAIKYHVAYRRTQSSRYFAAQVRGAARQCRDDIISMMPGLVTAKAPEIEAVNADLVRLVIRSQTGYWHQTASVARPRAPVTRPNKIRLLLRDFARDRAIQVAIIALITSLLTATITSVMAYMAKDG